MIKKNFIAIFVLTSLVSLTSCKNNDKFKIEKGKVGQINTQTKINVNQYMIDLHFGKEYYGGKK